MTRQRRNGLSGLILAALALTGGGAIAQTRDGAPPPDQRAQLCGTLVLNDTQETPEKLACWGRENMEQIHRLFAAHPVADANRRAADGDFRLIGYLDPLMGPGSPPGAECLLAAPESILHGQLVGRDFVRGDHYASDVLLRLRDSYASAFNRAIVAHPSYPYPDLCRVQTEPYGKRFEPAEWLAATAGARGDGTLPAATRLGRLEEARVLLDRGADPDLADPWQVTPLAWAALRGDAALTRLLLVHGADPRIACDLCPTVLNRALDGGSSDVVALLISAGADVNAPNPSHDEDNRLPDWDVLGAPPALTAVSHDDLASLKLLLQAGADPNAHTDDRLALVQIAARRGFAPGVRALVEAGAISEARSAFEEELWRRALDHGRDAILPQLVDRGARLHLLSASQRAAARAAVDRGDAQTLSLLIEEADRRRKALRAAVAADDVETTRRMLAEGAGLMRGHGETELLFAVARQQTAIIRLLLDLGADPAAVTHPDDLDWVEDQDSPFHASNSGPKSAMHLAFDTGPFEIVDAVSSRMTPNDSNRANARNDSFWRIALSSYDRLKDPRIVERARVLGGAPALTGLEADRLLASLCRESPSTASLAPTYLNIGYRPRAAGQPALAFADPEEEPALPACLSVSNPAAAMLLLDAGADPDQPGPYGPPLIAVISGFRQHPAESVRMIERLLDAGADPDTRAWGPGDPLTFLLSDREETPDAERAPYDEAARLLRAHGGKTQEELPASEPKRPPPPSSDIVSLPIE
jgi:ankyrin repeat protein